MKILSPAKINLFLQITGKRPDDYHELFSLMCRITLFDEILIKIESGDTIALFCSEPGVPTDDTNLARRAASLFLSKLGTTRGIHIHLKKNIPVAAGLGGGSSNAASILMALNRYYDRPFSRDQLMELGLTLGADVPFFIFQKPAIATGIGEQLEAFNGALPYHILLLYPGFNVSTTETYQNLNFGLTNGEKKPTSNHLKLNRFDPERHLVNDLEQVTSLKYPVIGVIKEKLVSLGAIGALMSGSGPTVFGLFDNVGTAKKAEQTLVYEMANEDSKSFLAEPIVEEDSQ